MKKSVTLNFKIIEDKKKKATSTLIVNLLKTKGIPGSMALNYYRNYGPEYLVRKTHLLDFYNEKSLHLAKPRNNRAWLISAISNDYDDSDDKFQNWLKRRKDDIVKNGSDDMRALLSV